MRFRTKMLLCRYITYLCQEKVGHSRAYRNEVHWKDHSMKGKTSKKEFTLTFTFRYIRLQNVCLLFFFHFVLLSYIKYQNFCSFLFYVFQFCYRYSMIIVSARTYCELRHLSCLGPYPLLSLKDHNHYNSVAKGLRMKVAVFKLVEKLSLE